MVTITGKGGNPKYNLSENRLFHHQLDMMTLIGLSKCLLLESRVSQIAGFLGYGGGFDVEMTFSSLEFPKVPRSTVSFFACIDSNYS